MRLLSVARTKPRRAFAGAVLSVAGLAGSLVGVPGATALGGENGLPVVGIEPSEALRDLPVLWQGNVVGSDGHAVAGANVDLFARPPARDIQPGTELHHVATALTGPTGSFVIAADRAVAAGLTDPAGWVTLMAVARHAEGVSVALDSVAWQNTGGPLGGRWVTSPATLFSTSAAAADLPEPADLVVHERPGTLRLAKGPDEPPDRPRSPAPPGPRCVAAYRSERIGTRNVLVGDMHRERGWSGEFVYRDTKSTSFQSGWSQDGKNWGLAGSVSFGDEEIAEESGESSGWEPAEARVVYKEYLATMEFARFTWRCGEPDWYDVQTVEPYDWTGSLYDPEQGTPAKCDGYHKTRVEDGRDLMRSTNSSQTNLKAIDVAGFKGSTTTATSSATVQKWRNDASQGRWLCGDRDYPSQGHTRVVSLP